MKFSRWCLCAAVFLSTCYSLINGYSTDVKYSQSAGPLAAADGSDDQLGLLQPLGEDGGPAETDVQFDHFMPFEHYLSKRQALPDTTTIDNHDYYTSQFFPPGPDADNLWVNLTAKTGIIEDLAHNISDRYRFFAVHDLMFEFPYYGHIINSVAITTAGFIYVGTFLHQFIHLTQYIAPLQADFNPSLNENATVLVYSTGDQFTIQWDRVHNHDHVENGTFTFQLSLFKDGTIHFVYREIPLLVSEISTENHPVQVGLADSFYVDRVIPGSGGPSIIRSIFEYHRISLAASDNLAFSAYVITPLPNCIMATSCDECVSISNTSPFQCGWCQALNRCSDGFDRHRQEWFSSGCVSSRTEQCGVPTTTSSTAAETTTSSPAPPTTSATPPTTATMTTSPVVIPGTFQQTGLSTGTMAVVIVIMIVIFVLLVVMTGVSIAALVYGYKHPSSKFGQLMIKYRPQARNLNRVSASYNAESGKALI